MYTIDAPARPGGGRSFARLNAAPGNRIADLVTDLTRLKEQQHDIRVNTRELAVAPSDGSLMVGGSDRYRLREHGFNQLCSKLKLPAAYARRCDSDLRARNINRWLREDDRELLLRIEGDEVRAVLSAAYRIVNHSDILGWIESRIGSDTEIRYELNPAYLDVQLVGRHETGLSDARRDPLHRGLHLRNSEVGLSRVSISALVYRTICLNGLVMGTGRWAYTRRHIGRSDISEQVREAFDKAIDLSGQAATAFAGTRGIQVAEPEQALERIAARYDLSEDESTAVDRAFNIEPGDNLYSVINALTRAGNDDLLTIDSRHKLQTLGGRLTDLSATGRWIDN